MEKTIKLVGKERDISLAIASLHESMREEREFDVKILEEK